MKCEYHPEHEAVGTCGDCGKGICDLCKTVLGSKCYCPNCIDRLLNIKSSTVKSTKKGRSSWIKIAGGVAAVIIAIVLIVYFAGGNNPESANKPGMTTYSISVSGTSGVAFSGSFLITDPNGSSVAQLVNGVVPQTYTVTGSAVRVELQNQGDSGTLSVQILKGSTVVTQESTTDAFGMVSLAAVSISPDYVEEAYSVAYETTKSAIRVAVLDYCSGQGDGDLPVLDETYITTDCMGCEIIDMSLLLESQGGILDKVPEGCYASAGGNDDNCDGGAVGCSANKHYVWILSDSTTVHSICMGSDCNSNNADGYQGVWP